MIHDHCLLLPQAGTQGVAGAFPTETSIPAMAWPVQRYCRREGSSWVQVDDGTGFFTLHSKVSK